MPHVKENKFGPGQFESLVFKTWVSKIEGYGKQRVTGKLEGIYTVYCGEGNAHDFDVKETISFWNTEVNYEAGLETDGALLFEVHNFINKLDHLYEIAGRLVNYALEDWSDPCEVYEL